LLDSFAFHIKVGSLLLATDSPPSAQAVLKALGQMLEG